MIMTTLKACPNCSADLETTYQFCPQCGQNAHIHRFNLPHIFHEAFHAFTHADKGVFFLTRSLATRPGVTAREYVLEGKRKKYFNPFTFLLLVLGLNITVNSFVKPYTGKPARASVSTQQATSTIPEADRPFYERRKEATTFIEKHINVVGLIAIPIFSLIFWLCFLRSGINYAEHLVANVFFSCFFSLAFIVVTLVLGFLLPAYLPFLNNIMLVFQLVYLTVGYYQFMNYHRPVQYVRTGGVSLLALMTWFMVSGGAVMLYIKFG